MYQIYVRQGEEWLKVAADLGGRLPTLSDAVTAVERFHYNFGGVYRIEKS